jgi:hypothetical protein
MNTIKITIGAILFTLLFVAAVVCRDIACRQVFAAGALLIGGNAFRLFTLNETYNENK